MKVIQITINNYYMDKKNKDDQAVHLFLGICLVALGMSLLGNMLVEYLSK